MIRHGGEGAIQPRFLRPEGFVAAGVQGCLPGPQLLGIGVLSRPVRQLRGAGKGVGQHQVDGRVQPCTVHVVKFFAVIPAVVQPGGPFVEIPVALFPGRDHQPVFHAVQEKAQQPPDRGHHFPGRFQIPGIQRQIPQAENPAQAEGGDGDGRLSGGADFQQTVRPLALGHEPQAGRGKIVLSEGVITAQGLVPGIHGVQGLFPPGAVLVMLVHAVFQRPPGNIEDAVHQAVPAAERTPPGYGIGHGNHRAGKHLHPPGGEDHEIPPGNPPEIMGKFRFSGGDPVREGEIPAAYPGAGPQVLQMFPVTEAQGGFLGAGYPEGGQAHFLPAQVEQEVRALRALRRGGQEGPLHFHGHRVAAPQQIASRGVQHGFDRRTYLQPLHRPGIQRRVRPRIHHAGRRPGIFRPGGIAVEGEAQLTGDLLHGPAGVQGAFPGQSVRAADQPQGARLQGENQPRRAGKILKGTLALMIGVNFQPVFPGAQKMGYVDFIVGFVHGEIVVLIAPGENAVEICHIFVVRADEKPGLGGNFLQRKIPPKFYILIHARFRRPDPLGVLKNSLHEKPLLLM